MPDRRGQSRSQNFPFGGSVFWRLLRPLTNLPRIYNSTLSVMPLPAEGQPDSFSGAIGKFRMETGTDLQESEVGEPIMLSLKLTGEETLNASSHGIARQLKLENLQPGNAIRDRSKQRHAHRKTFRLCDDPAKSRHTQNTRSELCIPRSSHTQILPNSRVRHLRWKSPRLTPCSSPMIGVKQPTNQTETAIPGLNLSRAMTREEALMTLDYQPQASRRLHRRNPFTSAWFVALNACLLVVTVLAGQFLRGGRCLGKFGLCRAEDSRRRIEARQKSSP